MAEIIYCARTGEQEVCVQKTQGLWICLGCGQRVYNVVTT